MKAQIRSAGVLGVEAFTVEVSVEIAPGGPPAFHVIGLAINAAKECGIRVRAALTHAGFKLPSHRITVNLVPADVRKDGGAFDLPIAIGILAALGQAPADAADGLVLLGELSFDGALRRVNGSLPVALHAKATGARGIILPNDCANEAAAAWAAPVYGASTLAEVIKFLRGETNIPLTVFVARTAPHTDIDLSEVRGLETARRALEVAAAGGHNLCLIGPPGSGKSLLARCLPTILPALSEQEALETSAIYSVAGKLDGAGLLTSRPFRAPHHDLSITGLVGDGPVPRPGEISLAHHGVLFLDELPEFRRDVLQALRQPLDDRRVTIVRARAALTYPAAFQLVAAFNPCPCGYRGSALRTCVCSDEQVRRYLGRISQPLLDRFDLHVEIPHVAYRTLRTEREGEKSATVRERVVAARVRQHGRMQGSGRSTNSEMGPRQLREHCLLDDNSDRLLASYVTRFGLSGRAVHRILRVARTIADLAGRDGIAPSDVAEAIALRALDRGAS